MQYIDALSTCGTVTAKEKVIYAKAKNLALEGKSQ